MGSEIGMPVHGRGRGDGEYIGLSFAKRNFGELCLKILFEVPAAIIAPVVRKKDRVDLPTFDIAEHEDTTRPRFQCLNIIANTRGEVVGEVPSRRWTHETEESTRAIFC